MRRGRVRDVIDQPAERIDLEHRLALRARQDPHRGVERAARGAAWRARRCRSQLVCWRRSSADVLLTAPGTGAGRPGNRRPNNPFATPKRPHARDPEFAEADVFAQRVPRPQQSYEMPRQRHNGGDFERKPHVLDLHGQMRALFQHGPGAVGKPVQAGEQFRRRARRIQRLDARARGLERIQRDIDAVECCGSPSRNPGCD